MQVIFTRGRFDPIHAHNSGIDHETQGVVDVALVCTHGVLEQVVVPAFAALEHPWTSEGKSAKL